jgi:transcription termination factor Rho
MHLSELKSLHVGQLLEMAIANDIEGANRLRKQELVFALLKNRAKKGEPIYGDGVMEVLPDGFGFLRSPDTSYLRHRRHLCVAEPDPLQPAHRRHGRGRDPHPEGR